jgi:hypothetical protein
MWLPAGDHLGETVVEVFVVRRPSAGGVVVGHKEQVLASPDPA